MRWANAPLALLLLASFSLAGCAGIPKVPIPGLDQSSTQQAPTTTAAPLTTVPDVPSVTPTAAPAPVPTLTTTSPEPGPISLAWANPSAATIRPGVPINGGLCTANFVFTSPDNATVYLGTAAHCVTVCPQGDNAGCGTNGCTGTDQPLPLGATLAVAGASMPATVAYNSWSTMREKRETDPEVCGYNDFALLRLDPADVPRVSPAMLHFGGPTGLASASDAVTRHKVLSYGGSYVEPASESLHAKEGYIVRTGISPWTTTVFSVPPSIPGDSGSPVLLGDGRALGTLAAGEISPVLGASEISSLDLELQYLRTTAGIDARLVTSPLTNPGSLPETEPVLPTWVPSGYNPFPPGP